MLRFLLLLGLGAALLVVGACDEQPPESPLIQAARTGSLDTIELLLDAGADVNMPAPTGDDWDATPLQHAILARQSGAVRLPLGRGADPNRIGPNAPAPLLLAAGDADPTFVTLPLAHGADPTHELQALWLMPDRSAPPPRSVAALDLSRHSACAGARGVDQAAQPSARRLDVCRRQVARAAMASKLATRSPCASASSN